MMLINARPRFVSKGFEALVPTQRAEFLHRRLIEMTNNEVNAWSVFRPVATSTDNWDQNIDDLSTSNFPFHPLYAGNYQEMASTHQAQSTNFLKPSYGEMHESPCPSYRRPAMLQQTYDGSTSEMDCVGNPSPMLGVDYTQWNLGRRQGSFAEFSNAQNGLKNSYQSSNEADITLFASANSLAQPQSPYQSLSGGSSDDILKSDKMSPSTVYSSYSSPSASIDPQSLAYLLPNAHEALTKSTWWPEHSQPSKNQSREIYGMLPPHDGLSQGYGPQHEWNNVWNFSGGSATSWVLAQATPATVSPKALTLNVPPAPLSSSGSSQGRALSHSDSNTGSSSGDDNSDFSGPETLSVVEPPRAVRRPRQILPDSVPGSQRIYQAVASDVPAKSSRKRLFKSRSGSDEEEESNQPYRSPTSKAKASSPKRVGLAPLKLFVPKRIEPKPAELSAASQGTQDRDVKDDFLVKSKLSGMSYKEIRRQGNFTEAESTLRGRFRTLTKHKAARVRKPEWCENDIRLLKKAVRKLAKGPDLAKCRVPWKKVADYIANNGGSYHFGNATCRKRWDDLQLQADS